MEVFKAEVNNVFESQLKASLLSLQHLDVEGGRSTSSIAKDLTVNVETLKSTTVNHIQRKIDAYSVEDPEVEEKAP